MDLFEDLKSRVQCSFISDLKGDMFRQNTILELDRMEPEQYPCNQWNDAVEYFTSHKRNFDNGSAAKDFIIKNCFL